MITQKLVKELFKYKDGELYWMIDSAYNVKKGFIAGSLGKKGYKRTCIKAIHYLNHRLIFLYHNGYFPKKVDHIDGNPLNNKIENLREVTVSQNGMNRKTNFNSFTKIKNVTKAGKKWRVAITKNNKYIHIGFFADLELAELVAIEARNKYHGEYANHG